MKIQVQISWVGQSTRVAGACLNAKTALLPNLLAASPGKCSGTLSTICWDELQHQLVLESSIIILLAIVAQVFAKQRLSYVWSLGGGAVQQAPRWGNLVIIVQLDIFIKCQLRTKWIHQQYDSFSDVGESRVWFAGKNLTPCRMHWNAFLIAQIIAKCHSFPNMCGML